VQTRELGAVATVACAFALAALGGCGRRATSTDCQLIVDRSVELQLKELNLGDAAAIAERERQVRDELGDDIKSCESRRVTDKTMVCVRSASSTQELDRCLR
jgi:hypothetical protein